MRRDMEYCIEIMQKISNGDYPNVIHLQNGINNSISEEDLKRDNKYFEHLKLLEDGGFIKVNLKGSGVKRVIHEITITWNGNDFLDMAENQTLWEKTKNTVKEKGLEMASLPLDVITGILKMKAKEMLGLVNE